jgi:hypothetical protein
MIKEFFEFVIGMLDELAKHKFITIVTCLAVLALSCVLSAMYIGRDIPWLFGSVTYRPWMAYSEVIGNGLVFGSTIGYVMTKK